MGIKGSKEGGRDINWGGKPEGKNKESIGGKWKSSQGSRGTKVVKDENTKGWKVVNWGKTGTKERPNLHTWKKRAENKNNITTLWYTSRRV